MSFIDDPNQNMQPSPLGILFSRSVLAMALAAGGGRAVAQSPYQASADFVHYAQKLRESAILHMEPQVIIPTNSHITSGSNKFPWKSGIVTTIFWVGEPAGGNNPVHNFSSSWDLNWEQSYGGYDNPNPANRRNFIPANFVPRQNPFYIALPYNDVTHGTTKPDICWQVPLAINEEWDAEEERTTAPTVRVPPGRICATAVVTAVIRFRFGPRAGRAAAASA